MAQVEPIVTVSSEEQATRLRSNLALCDGNKADDEERSAQQHQVGSDKDGAADGTRSAAPLPSGHHDSTTVAQNRSLLVIMPGWIVIGRRWIRKWIRLSVGHGFLYDEGSCVVIFAVKPYDEVKNKQTLCCQRLLSTTVPHFLS